MAARLTKLQKNLQQEQELLAKYKSLGYPDEWIELRMQYFRTHRAVVDAWKKRGAKTKQEHDELTDIILFTWSSHHTDEYKELIKDIKPDDDLHDHMTMSELAIATHGEKEALNIMNSYYITSKVSNQDVARWGGKKAAQICQNTEKKYGTIIVTRRSYPRWKIEQARKKQQPNLLDRIKEN